MDFGEKVSVDFVCVEVAAIFKLSTHTNIKKVASRENVLMLHDSDKQQHVEVTILTDSMHLLKKEVKCLNMNIHTYFSHSHTQT